MNQTTSAAPGAYQTPDRPSLAVAGSNARAAIGRIFCVGRNYADHAKEMGAPPEPVFFMKPAEALITDGAAAPYPADTERLDHEVELALVLGAGGAPASPDEARALIFGYAVAIDLTRRDVQAAAKAAGAPWEAAKAFDGSCPMSDIAPAAQIGHPRTGAIWLDVDGVRKQSGDLGQMLIDPDALLVRLARHWRLLPGDVVLTGTPAGVGPVTRGARITAAVDGVGALETPIV